jgi:hypothetical protein
VPRLLLFIAVLLLPRAPSQALCFSPDFAIAASQASKKGGEGARGERPKKPP